MRLLERIKRFVFKSDNTVIEIPTSVNFWTVGVAEVASHPLFRAALMRITASAASVPLNVYDGDRLIADHHLTQRFADNFTTPQAVQTIIADLYVYGNSFWQIRRVGKKAVGLTYIPPTSVSVFNDRLQVFGEQGTMELTKDDVVWFKLTNPADPEGLGLSIAQSIVPHIKTLIEVDRASSEFLANGALPFAVFKIQTPVDKEVYEREREKLRTMFGRGNRFGWLVTSKGVEIEKLDTQLRLGDLPEIRKTLREEILAILGVPPAVLGFYEYANYANAREQTKIFWRETVIPLLTYIAETLTNHYLTQVKPSLWCEFDLTAIPYTKERLDEIADSLTRLVSAGIMTINEAREILGLNEPLEWGDVWWGNLNTVPIAEKEGD